MLPAEPARVSSHQTLLATFASQLIGEAADCPAPSEVVTMTAIQELEEKRPDLANAVRIGLELAERTATDDVFELRSSDPETFDALALAIAAVYLTNPDAAAALGYFGRLALDIGSIEENAAELRSLSAPVVERGTTPWRLFDATT